MREFIVAFFIFAAALMATGVALRACGVVGEAADVAQEQAGPRALLKKYEWFKDAAAELDAKMANIHAAEARLREMDRTYYGAPRDKWSREDREQANLWSTEVAGLVANYNALAADYNAAMAKISWRFANAGDVPAGADPLPRQFRTYQTGEDR